MDLLRSMEAQYRISHRHSDGSWVELEPKPDSHDPAATDPEREWPNGKVFRCASCYEEVVLVRPEDDPATGGR
ncbi:MAG TPA: hypothetical protein VIM30_14315 [Candidatus Limnocylindrales bacterium]|jgi:hypothetical protein